MNQSIELPPLPEARIVSYQIDSTMRSMELRTYSDQDMQEYARAAIEADRQRRGEPVAYRLMRNNGNGVWLSDGRGWCEGRPEPSLVRGVEGDPQQWRIEYAYPAPQPAEPVKKIEIKAEDLSIITYSPTPRPQWVSHIDRGVRVVHLPTGLMAECHEERSPHRNREIALAKLKKMIAAEPVSQHPDDVAVDAFAAAMKAKLKRAREEKGRGGWQDMSATVLSDMLREHVQKGDPVDVANLAMMLHQNGQGIATRRAGEGAERG